MFVLACFDIEYLFLSLQDLLNAWRIFKQVSSKEEFENELHLRNIQFQYED